MACLLVAKGISHLGLLSLLGIVPLKASSVNMPASKKKVGERKAQILHRKHTAAICCQRSDLH